MEIISAVLIGVTIGALAAVRVIRSPLSFLLIVTSVFALFLLVAVRSGGIQSTRDLGGVLAVIAVYGSGFVFFMALPGGVAFGLITLFRRACRLHQSTPKGSAANLRFTWCGGLCAGLFYLVYGVGLLATSKEMDTDLVLRVAVPNQPILWLMVLFNIGDTMTFGSWRNAACFTMVGTFLYTAVGAVAGLPWDLIRSSHQRDT